MMGRSKCFQGGQLHKFEPRYTEQERSHQFSEAKGITVEGARKLLTLDIYVGDICVWCGQWSKPLERKT